MGGWSWLATSTPHRPTLATDAKGRYPAAPAIDRLLSGYPGAMLAAMPLAPSDVVETVGIRDAERK